ncbi:MAG: chromosomal replication initiator protein DnaA [Notoacmeibacter sp.]|nr:chromosomal replication initiator protein DnaA [Notoacmeibacter sp.]
MDVMQGAAKAATGGVHSTVPAAMGNEAMTGTAGQAEGAFERVRAQLKAQLGTEVYSSWFGRMKLVEASRSEIRLSVPTAFLRSWINNHYIDLVTELCRKEFPEMMRLDLVVRSATRLVRPPVESAAAAAAAKAQRTVKPSIAQAAASTAHIPANDRHVPKPAVAAAKGNQQSVLGSPLDARYTFDNFVEGPANRIALAAGRTVAESGSGAIRFNPLFIHASVGLGKTHLLQAIASEALRARPGSRVVYLTAEYFMWRFATAIRDNSALMLKDQLRDIDLLIIDDMQFLQGKTIQNEFCHLINMLLDSAKQVVIAADRPATELESLEPRVRSRLLGGVALEMGQPDYEMRLSMLKNRLDAARVDDPGIEISEDILSHVARTVAGSGRELEGAFNQLLFRRSFEPDLTVDRVDELLGHIYRSGEPKRVRIEDIQRIVARHYNVSKSELLSNRRTRTIVKPRQVAMYLSKVLTPRSLPEIGRRFGGRDHTTVLHAVRKIEDLTVGDNTLAQEIELLKRLINEQA